MKFTLEWVEKIVRNAENTGYLHFYFSHNVFKRLIFHGRLKSWLYTKGKHAQQSKVKFYRALRKIPACSPSKVDIENLKIYMLCLSSVYQYSAQYSFQGQWLFPHNYRRNNGHGCDTNEFCRNDCYQSTERISAKPGNRNSDLLG